MEFKLYNRNLTAPVFDTDLTYLIQRPRFSTKLHGGFNLCSFALKAGLPEAWEWITRKAFYRLVVTDGQRTLWEGRVQDIGKESGLVVVTAYGYYASLNDEPYKLAYNANADVVIKAMLTASAPMINADQSHIDATGGPAITSAADSEYLDKKVRVLTEKLAAFGDTTGGQWYFAIWENRVPYFFQRSVSSIDWQVSLADFDRFKLRHSTKDLWNCCYAIYDAAGIARTAEANDTDSQKKYGDGTNNLVRCYAIPDLGTVAPAAAVAARDRWLAEHKDIWPSLEDLVLGSTVYNSRGVAFPSSWVRAGDVIRVRDLVPASSDLDAVTRDALRTFTFLKPITASTLCRISSLLIRSRWTLLQ